MTYGLIALCGFLTCVTGGVIVGARGLRKQLTQKNNAIEIWHNEANSYGSKYSTAQSKIHKLEIALDLKTADLIRCQTKLQKYKRVQGPGGKFIGRAK